VACLDEQTLAMLVARSLPERERAAVVAHVAGCGRCEDTLRVLVELYVTPDPGAAETVPSRGPRHEVIAIEQGTTLGRFVVVKELGRGGMGVVYEGYDPELDRKVALKVLRHDGHHERGDLQSRLHREAQAMARLVHPNVVTVLDVGLDTHGPTPRLFVAMEYVAGTTLRGWIEAQPRSLAEIVRVFAEAGRGLAAAHRAGIVHRDFKPDNVLIDHDGHPRVTDFGLARAFGDAAAAHEPATATSHPRFLSTELTEADAIVGTPSYMAPEQIDDRDVGPAADQFAWFVALHEALFGARPFPERSLEARIAAIRQGALTMSSSERPVPARLRAALRRGLAFEPAARFADMGAAVRAVERARRSRVAGVLLAGLPVAAAAVVLAASRPDDASTRTACPDPDAELHGVWDPAVEQQVRERFTAVLPDSEAATTSVVQTLHERTAAWRAAMREVCEAQVPGQPVAPEVAVRADCLRRRKLELAGFMEGLLGADAVALRGGYAALRELPAIDTCSRPSRYLTEEHVLVDPQQRSEIDEIRDDLVRARALGVVGRPVEERDTIRRAVARARVLDYPPVLAEALVDLGKVQARLAEAESAEEALREAIRLAVAHRHHDVAARALLATMRQRNDAGAHDEARRLADLALGHVEALGGNDELRRDVLLQAGYGERLAGDLERARSLWDEAATLSSEPVDELIDALNLAVLAADLGHWGAAEAAMRTGVDLAPQLYGPVHGATAMLHHNLAAALCGVGRPDDALAEYGRASDVYTALYGKAHPVLAEVDLAAAACLRDAGRIDHAGRRLDDARRSLAHRASIPQRDDLDADGLALEAHTAPIADVLVRLDVLEDRIGEHEGHDSLAVAELQHGVGRALAARGQSKQAVVLLRTALRAHERRLGPHMPATAAVRAELGIASIEVDPAEARAQLDRALADLQPEHGHPRVRIEALRARARLREAAEPGDARRDRAAADAIADAHPQLQLR
jgi:eukaryotic-like serine/threonine-protein kinase